MAVAPLPPAFRKIQVNEAEREAIAKFLEEAPKVAPLVNVVAPRRSSQGHIKIVVEFPENIDTWDMTGDLIDLIQRIRKETGVYLHLD